MFEYKTLEPLLLKSFSTALAMGAKISVSGGSFDYTPLAVRWLLNVKITTNGRDAHFEIVENMLVSFIESTFCQMESNRMEIYTQTPGGFSVVFAPGLMDNASTYCRRYIKCVDVDMRFLHVDQAVEPLFDQMTQLADFGMSSLHTKLVDLAPAVFEHHYKRVIEMEGTFEPLALGLGLDSSMSLRCAAEKEYLSTRVAPQNWGYKSNQKFFKSIEYCRRDFIPITDELDELDCTHEHIFWNEMASG